MAREWARDAEDVLWRRTKAGLHLDPDAAGAAVPLHGGGRGRYEIIRTMSLNVVILAAGLGKRMHSQLPKVLHALAGRPLLAHVIDTARALDAARIVVVYGHGGEQVREAVSGPDLAFARQEPQLGTGARGPAGAARCSAKRP